MIESMKDVWPEAYLPKENRASFIEMVGMSILGAFALAVALEQWSWTLAVIGVLMMVASTIMGPRRYLRSRRRWYDDALWLLLSIAPMYGLYKSMKGPKEVPKAGTIGLGVFIVWTLFQAYLAWFLWHTAGCGVEDESKGVMSA